MKILVVINDMQLVYEDLSHTGVSRNAKRRSVEVELTQEQVEKIGIQDFETIESVSAILEHEVKKQNDDLNF